MEANIITYNSTDIEVKDDNEEKILYSEIFEKHKINPTDKQIILLRSVGKSNEEISTKLREQYPTKAYSSNYVSQRLILDKVKTALKEIEDTTYNETHKANLNYIRSTMDSGITGLITNPDIWKDAVKDTQLLKQLIDLYKHLTLNDIKKTTENTNTHILKDFSQWKQ